jgi:dTDP-4-dehydrorhamnose 3,5-epimerase-like enzyme
VLLITPARHGDDRGFLSEVYSRQALTAAGIDLELVQDNYSLSAAAGTVRGLPYQVAPMAQAKFARVIRGAIFDVAVDLRRQSPIGACPRLTSADGSVGLACGQHTMHTDDGTHTARDFLAWAGR